MVREVDEHGVGGGREEGFVVARVGGLSAEDFYEDFGGHVFAFVVDLASFVDVLSRSTERRFIEELSWEWVLAVTSNIIISHGNNILWFHAFGDENLVGVADVGLVTVVPESVGTRN